MTWRRVMACVFWPLVFAGCSGDGDPGAAAPEPADFSGRWAFAVRATSTTCTGLDVPTSPEAGYLDITQAGSTLAVEHLDQCGQPVYAAPGSVSGSVAVIVAEDRVCTDLACCYDVRITETVTLTGDALDGDVGITVSASGCGGPDATCGIYGVLSATLCPAGGCPLDSITCP